MTTEIKSKKPTLGVVAISFNEERDIKAFIGHLLPWVEEIVIVDDGSTDKTKEIAAAGGSKVNFIASPRKNDEYFSHQRNKGIAASRSEWLLHMDIDERVTPALAGEMLNAIQDKSKDAYRYRRLNYFLHRPMIAGGWQDWNQVHLAKKEIFKFAGMYHESCIVDTPKERIGQLNTRMIHLNDETYKERMQKSMLYCQEQATHLSNRGMKIKGWHFLALPIKVFVHKILIKQGWKDGTLGLLFALHSACAMFKACALVWDKQNSINRDEIEDRLQKKWKSAGNVRQR